MNLKFLLGLVIATGVFLVILTVEQLLSGRPEKETSFRNSIPKVFGKISHKTQASQTIQFNQNDEDKVLLRLKQLDDLFIRRKSDILSRCKEHKLGVLKWTSLFSAYAEPRSVVSSKGKIKLDVCLTAKSGTGFWKSVFTYLLGSKSLIRDQKRITNNEYKGKIATYYYGEWNLKSKEAPRHSFVIIRSIWSRLVSLYRQKITFTTDREWTSNFIRLCGKFQIDPRTFSNMLVCILKLVPETKLDVHWTPAVHRCHICDGMFDFIVRMENMAQENLYILHKAGVELKEAQYILQYVRNVTRRDSEMKKPPNEFQFNKQFYSSVPKSIIKELVDFYRLENLVLGYPLTPFESFDLIDDLSFY